MSSVESSRDLLAVAREAIRAEAQAVARVEDQLDESFIDAVNVVLETTGKVLVTGSGTSSHVARRMAHLFAVSGTPAMFIHSMDALHGTVGAVQEGDTLIALSKTGESKEVVDLCGLSKARGAKIIGVGENPESALAHISDVFACVTTGLGGDPEGTIAMGSTLVVGVWGDALARVLMQINGWELEDSLEIHPAGGVGIQARKLVDSEQN